MGEFTRRIAAAQHEIRLADFNTESFEISSLPVLLPATAALVLSVSEGVRQLVDTDLHRAQTFAWWFAIPLLDVITQQTPDAGETLVTQVLAALLARVADDAAEHDGERAPAEMLEALVGNAAPASRDNLRRLVALARQPEADWAPGSADAWHRAAPVVFVPEWVILGTPQAWCKRFRDYLSLTILVDDANDVLEDIRAGRATWPARRTAELGWSPMRGGVNERLVTDIAGAVMLYRDRIAIDNGDAHTLMLLSQLLRP